jgi:lysozyme
MTLNSVIDLSHHNGNVNLNQAKLAGIVGVIHKATQGVGFIDSMYQANRIAAQKLDLLWGAYHFGTAENPSAQADHFIQVSKPDAQTLLVLDLEPNPGGNSMNLAGAKAFIARIHQVTGRWPGLYSSASYLSQFPNLNEEPLFLNCWLWLARYGENPKTPTPWKTWTMWQYTDGSAGPAPHSVPGVGNCDRNIFNGDLPGLHRLWGAHLPVS